MAYDGSCWQTEPGVDSGVRGVGGRRVAVTDDGLSLTDLADITAYVDIEAQPVAPTAVLIFGTNQAVPVVIASDLYHRGLAPLIIATGGVNRHNGIVEGREFRRLLCEAGVPEHVIRYEDRSANTWQNVEFAMPHLREALTAGLPVTAVSKWYHRRAIHALGTQLPDTGAFHAISWEPVYAGATITRANWYEHPDGRRRVIREAREIPRRVASGELRDLRLIDGAWR
jgi:uncharacterized SAM-binding protein YcdF (DUF218 family)